MNNSFYQQIQAFTKQNDPTSFNLSVKRMMENEQQEPLRIAFVGETGVGKSTLINTVRGFGPDDPEAADTSSADECTMEVREYPDPRNPKLLLYSDLPGVGSPNFPKEEYTSKVPLEKYDFFILLSNNRFKDNDLYLAKEIQRLGKKLYFVRTRIDESLFTERNKRRGQPFDEGDYIRRVREIAKEKLMGTVGDRPVFVLSGSIENYTKWDFPKLIQTLIDDAPDLKREAIIRTITANSREAIEKKVAVLKQRIFLVAIAAAAVGAVPIPFLPFTCNLGIITREVHDYMKDFGLDETSLRKLAANHHMSLAEFQAKIFGNSELLQSNEASVIAEVVQKTLAKTVAMNIGGECARVIPVVGQLLPSVTAYTTVTYTLETLLSEISTLSIQLVEELVQLNP